MDVTLSDSQRSEFRRSGFLVLGDVLDDADVTAARRAVWDAIPQDPDDEEALYDTPERTEDAWENIDDPSPFAAINEALHAHARALVSEDLEPPGEHMQIALRYPETAGLQAADAPQPRDLHGHVDGYGSTFHETGEYTGFQLGASVYLDDVVPRGGGFTVWPGSHWRAAQYFAEHELETMGEVHSATVPGDVGDPFEIAGEAGTVVLWHNKLVHSGGVNLSGNLRMAAIQRFRREDHESVKRDAADKPWKYWEGMTGRRPGLGHRGAEDR